MDPTTGAVLSEIGSTGSAWISNIDFAPDGTLFASEYFDTEVVGDGGVSVLDPATAARTQIGRFDAADAPRELEYGGLTVDPICGELWGVESNFASPTPRYLYRIDRATGRATDAFPLTLNGEEAPFGFSGLEALPDGRLIGTRPGSSQLYEITPNPVTGAADLVLLPLGLPALAGHLNGLETVPSAVTPEALVAEIVALVDSGALAAGKGRSLITKVMAARMLMEKGNAKAAIRVLEAMIHQIEALVRSGDLTPEQGAG
ncbi:MAG: FIMAH domain-containing protein, partial [Gemmatimonadota bacterium]